MVTINPAECDRTTVYTGECRNLQDTEWIRFDSGRRRSPNAHDGDTWLIDVGYGSFWVADDQVRDLVRLVPAREVTLEDRGVLWALIRDELRREYPSATDDDHRTLDVAASAAADAVVEHLNANHPKPDAQADAEWLERALNNPDEQLVALDEARIEANIQRNRAVRERDAAVARAEAAERVLRERDEQEDDATRAACERAEAAEARAEAMDKQAHTWASMYKVAAARAEAAEDRATLAEQERENWRVTAINRTAPAVSRADIEKAIDRWKLTGQSRGVTLADDLHALVSGSDPAVYVVRESDIAAFTVERSFDGRWFADDEYSGHENVTPEGKREQRDVVLRLAAKHEAVARAIEAEQAVDPVEEQMDALADILYSDELVTDQMRGVLERVVRAGMLFPSEVTSDE